MAGRPVVLSAATHQATRLLKTAYEDAWTFLDDVAPRPRPRRVASASYCTLAAAYMRPDGPPDGATMILDEVSMASLPALIAGVRSVGHIVVGGDLLQLGPVISGPERVRRLVIAPPFGLAPLAAAPQRAVVRLQHSRRLPAPVATLLRSVAYGPGGPTGHAFRDRPLAGTGFGGALTLVDVGGVGPGEATDRLYRTLRGLAASVRKGAGGSPWLAIAPTHARLAVLEPHVGPGWDLTTIHGAQGREAAVVVVDLIGEPANRPWYAATGPLDDGGRLLTVALSRGSRHTIVALDLERHRGGPGLYWTRVLEIAVSHGIGRVERIEAL
jgi:hypothetical protein